MDQDPNRRPDMRRAFQTQYRELSALVASPLESPFVNPRGVRQREVETRLLRATGLCLPKGAVRDMW